MISLLCTQAMMVDQPPLQGWEGVGPIAQAECDDPVVSIDYSPECECTIDFVPVLPLLLQDACLLLQLLY
jgi:hypothetical protein